MIFDHSIYQELYIFSGYKISYEEYAILSQNIDFNEECDAITGYHFFVGKVLVRGDNTPERMEWSNFSLDDIREYSINESVRKVRFELIRLLPDKYTNEYPKLFIVSI